VQFGDVAFDVADAQTKDIQFCRLRPAEQVVQIRGVRPCGLVAEAHHELVAQGCVPLVVKREVGPLD
jgi:hypothetical protein